MGPRSPAYREDERPVGLLGPIPIETYWLVEGRLMAVEWFFQSRGKILGPFAPDQLRRLVLEGKVSQETQVRRGREGEWVPASRVRRLFDEVVAVEQVSEPRLEEQPAPGPGMAEEEAYALVSAEGTPQAFQETVVEQTPRHQNVDHSAPDMESTLFRERGIVVNPRMILLGDSIAYAVRHVTALKRGETRHESPWPIILVLGGGLLVLGGISLMPSGESAIAVLLFLTGLGLVIAGIRNMNQVKSEPWITISFSSGETKQIADQDTGFLDRIWKALIEAVRHCP